MKMKTVLIALACLMVEFYHDEIGGISWMSASVNRLCKNPGDVQSYPVKASTRIYKGQLVCVDSGYLLRASDSLGILFVGVAAEAVYNSGSSGDVFCKVYRKGIFRFSSFSAIEQARLGEQCYCADDNQVYKYSGDAHLCLVGVMVELEPVGTGTYVWVDIHKGTNLGSENGVFKEPFEA